MAVIDVRTVDEFFNYVMDSKKSDDNMINIIGNNLQYRLIIKGDSWNGNVNIRTADYIKSLHETFSLLYALVDDIKIGEARKYIQEKAPIEIKLEDGSAVIELLNVPGITDFFIDRLKNMDDESFKFLFTFIIASTFSYLTISQVMKYFSKKRDQEFEVKKLELELKEKHNVRYTFENIISIIQKPNQILSQQLDNDDVIVVQNTGETVTAKEAKERFKYKVVADEETFHSDDKYKVIVMEAIENNYIGKIVSEDDIVLKVIFNVNEEEKDQLLNSLGKREFIYMKLNVDTKDDKLTRGTVFSLDKARETSKSLSTILEMLQED